MDDGSSLAEGQIDSSSKNIPFSVDGNAEHGMSEYILKIKLAMEAKRWDVMVDRIEVYLKDTWKLRREIRDRRRREQQNEQAVQRQATKKNQGDEEEQTNVVPKERALDLTNHVDKRGVTYKKPYDKSQAQGDDEFGQDAKENLQKLYDKCTMEKVFTKEDLELIACAFKSQLKENR